MTLRRLLTILVFACTLLFAAGCGDGGKKPSFTVLNDSGAYIKYLAITEAGPVLNFAKLDHRESLTRGFTAETLPRAVNVYWEDREGQSHQTRVELWKSLPPDYLGPVKLTVDRRKTIRVTRA